MADFDKETLDRIVGLAAAGMKIDSDPLINGKQAVMVPVGYNLVQIDPIDKPLHDSIYQTVRHDTDESFSNYVSDFKTSSTRMFVTTGLMSTIFDYHGAEAGAAGASPDRLAHRANYPMPWSPQWKRWKGMADIGPRITQRAFLEFIEENGEDIRDPSAIELMERVGKVQSRKKIEFTSGLRLSNGEVELAYKEEIENSGGAVLTATMPTEMTIGIPVFLDGPAYEIRVFIRYHVDQGKLAFEIVLHRWEFSVEDAMKAAVEKIELATGLVAHWGAVER